MLRAGVFDFFETVYRRNQDEAVYKDQMKPSWKFNEWRTYQMSDHLPMWVELRTDFGDEYLGHVKGT